jgi:hypothetical protein
MALRIAIGLIATVTLLGVFATISSLAQLN